MFDAYAAGLVDADGSVIIAKVRLPTPSSRTPDYRLSVQVTNTYLPVLDMMVEEYGGSVSHKPLTVGSFLTRRQHYNWAVGSHKAAECLQRLLPYMVVKKEQAELALEFWEQRIVVPGRRCVPQEEIDKRERYYQAMKRMKEAPPAQIEMRLKTE